MVKPHSTFNSLVEIIVPNGVAKTIFDSDILLNGYKQSFFLYNKYKVLKDNIISNYFLDEAKKAEFMEYFQTLQKHYFSFLKFYNICRHRIIKLNSDFNYDLFFNNLELMNEKKKIMLIEQDTKYCFKIGDLLHMICVGLTHSDNLFVSPMAPRNPYTNLLFSYHNIVNIYMFCVDNQIMKPKIFNYYYEVNFDVYHLKLMYEPFLREYAIKSFYTEMSLIDKYETILEIINNNYAIIPINIHEEYPKIIVVDKLEQTILLNLKIMYSLIPYVRTLSKTALKNTLHQFYEKNKTFGKMYYNSVRNVYSIDNMMQYSTNSYSYQNLGDGSESATTTINARPFVFGENTENNTNNNANNNTNNNANNNTNVELDDDAAPTVINSIDNGGSIVSDTIDATIVAEADENTQQANTNNETQLLLSEDVPRDTIRIGSVNYTRYFTGEPFAIPETRLNQLRIREMLAGDDNDNNDDEDYDDNHDELLNHDIVSNNNNNNNNDNNNNNNNNDNNDNIVNNVNESFTTSAVDDYINYGYSDYGDYDDYTD